METIIMVFRLWANCDSLTLNAAVHRLRSSCLNPDSDRFFKVVSFGRNSKEGP